MLLLDASHRVLRTETVLDVMLVFHRSANISSGVQYFDRSSPFSICIDGLFLKYIFTY